MSIKIIEPNHEKQDFQRYYVDSPDTTFSPERNKWVIENSIKRYENNIRSKRSKYIEDIRERANAVDEFLQFVDKGGTKPIEKWIGAHELARLQGRRITTTILDSRNKLLKLGAN